MLHALWPVLHALALCAPPGRGAPHLLRALLALLPGPLLKFLSAVDPGRTGAGRPGGSQAEPDHAFVALRGAGPASAREDDPEQDQKVDHLQRVLIPQGAPLASTLQNCLLHFRGQAVLFSDASACLSRCREHAFWQIKPHLVALQAPFFSFCRSQPVLLNWVQEECAQILYLFLCSHCFHRGLRGVG